MARSATASAASRTRRRGNTSWKEWNQRRPAKKPAMPMASACCTISPMILQIGRANELQGGDGFLLVERQRVDDKGDDYRRHDEQEPRKEADLPARAFDDRTAENHLLLRLSEGGEMLPPPDLPGEFSGATRSADERARH